MATPSISASPRFAVAVHAHTNVVSTANCTPNSGSPSTTTSNLRPSPALAPGTSKSRTKAFVLTRPPASLQMRAAALSNEKPRRLSTPARRHAARWWPKEETATRTTREGKLLTKSAKQENPKQVGRDGRFPTVGVAVKGAPAPGPPYLTWSDTLVNMAADSCRAPQNQPSEPIGKLAVSLMSSACIGDVRMIWHRHCHNASSFFSLAPGSTTRVMKLASLQKGAVQEALVANVLHLQTRPDEIWMAQRCAQHGSTLVSAWATRSSPHHFCGIGNALQHATS